MNTGTWRSMSLIRERQRNWWRFLCRLCLLSADAGPHSFLLVLPNIEFLFFFISGYHTPLIIWITLEFTSGTEKCKKRDFSKDN